MIQFQGGFPANWPAMLGGRKNVSNKGFIPNLPPPGMPAYPGMPSSLPGQDIQSMLNQLVNPNPNWTALNWWRSPERFGIRPHRYGGRMGGPVQNQQSDFMKYIFDRIRQRNMGGF